MLFFLFETRPTIEILNALNVVLMQRKVLNVAVHGVHESLSHTGVIQAECVSELVGRHKEQAVAWNTTSRKLDEKMIM